MENTLRDLKMATTVLEEILSYKVLSECSLLSFEVYKKIFDKTIKNGQNGQNWSIITSELLVRLRNKETNQEESIVNFLFHCFLVDYCALRERFKVARILLRSALE